MNTTDKQLSKNKLYNNIVTLFAFLFVSYVIFFIITFFAAPDRAAIGLVSIGCSLGILNCFKTIKIPFLGTKSLVIVVVLMIALALAVGLYFFIEYPHLIYERDGANVPLDYVFGCLAVVLVIGIAWLSFGYIMPVIIIIFIFYGLFGSFFPGILYHPGIDPPRLLRETVLSISGIYGLLPQVGLRYVAIFIIFAGFVQSYGGLDFVIKISRAIAGKNERLIPQIAVVSSMAFGSFSGSAGANVAGTGSFTIPLMKQHKIPGRIAGGIEATASAGGQIMPPIMGAAAFVMAEYLGLPYSRILSAGIFPALLFFLTVLVAVYIITLIYMEASGESTSNEKTSKITLKFITMGIPMIVGVGIILYSLIAFKMDAMISGLYGVVGFLVSQIIYNFLVSNDNFLNTLKKSIISFAAGIKSAGVTTAPIIVLLSALGIIVKILVSSGLSTRLSYGLIDLGGGSLLLTIFLIMIVCIVFGMAVTTVAAYILTVIVAAPILIKLGIPPLAVHFTVFYFAMLSAITPPVAAIVPIAMAISGSKFFETAWEAMKLGASKYILPFYFIYHPEILEFNMSGLYYFFISSVGLIGITVGLQIKPLKLRLFIINLLLLALGLIVLFSNSQIIVWVSTALLLIAFVGLWLLREPYSIAVKRLKLN